MGPCRRCALLLTAGEERPCAAVPPLHLRSGGPPSATPSHAPLPPPPAWPPARSWFDLDLSSKPYRALRYHSYAVRGAAFHRSYPLFASSSDDGTVHVFHGRVYADLMTNPLIVPGGCRPPLSLAPRAPHAGPGGHC